jgi:hypothetical protein
VVVSPAPGQPLRNEVTVTGDSSSPGTLSASLYLQYPVVESCGATAQEAPVSGLPASAGPGAFTQQF